MKENYIFRPITKEEIPVMFDLIQQRVAWMDEVGIRQWNVTGYATVYPLEYYEHYRQLGQVYVLEDSETGQILSAAVLKEDDERWYHEAWSQTEPAVYLHNFVAKLGCPGVGSKFLELAEDHARNRGMAWFRLDSADDNAFLERYYTQRGYQAVGHCIDGLYTGILRQKALRP